jgi:molybdenum cofactor cytidylyltransferase
MRPFVSGLVLAAGASTRLGQPKQLLPVGDTTLLGTVLGEVRAAAALDEVIVVLGGAAPDVRQRVDLGGVRAVENPEFVQGCASSYRTGIGALDPRAEAVAILLGDQPGLDREIIDAVVGDWRLRPAPILLTAYHDGEGHPLVFSRALFESLVALRGDKAAWKLVDAQRRDVRRVAIDRPRPRDVNTWPEYEALFRPPR